MYDSFLSVTVQWQEQFKKSLQKWWHKIYVFSGFALFLLAFIQFIRYSLPPDSQSVSLE